MKNFIYKINRKIIKVILLIVSKNIETEYFGTSYGGWHFIKPCSKRKLTVISAGVGEDISFDIQFLNSFNSHIYFIDPTPRALAHLNRVLSNLGKNATTLLEDNKGRQKIESYDLKNVSIKNIHIINKALFNVKNERMKFYPPLHEENVSHSISNFQNNYSRLDDFIEVSSSTLKEIVETNCIKHIDIIKLDIEGAEIQVIPDMLKSKIYPDQILVEFDELNIVSLKALNKVFLIFINLFLNSYKSIQIDNYPNFLFVKKSYLADTTH
jgi:FkbM family methyltransferase